MTRVGAASPGAVRENTRIEPRWGTKISSCTGSTSNTPDSPISVWICVLGPWMTRRGCSSPLAPPRSVRMAFVSGIDGDDLVVDLVVMDLVLRATRLRSLPADDPLWHLARLRRRVGGDLRVDDTARHYQELASLAVVRQGGHIAEDVNLRTRGSATDRSDRRRVAFCSPGVHGRCVVAVVRHYDTIALLVHDDSVRVLERPRRRMHRKGLLRGFAPERGRCARVFSSDADADVLAWRGAWTRPASRGAATYSTKVKASASNVTAVARMRLMKTSSRLNSRIYPHPSHVSK